MILVKLWSNYKISLSPLRKLTNCTKWNILDEIFDFGNSVMPEHQWIEKMKNIAKRNIFGFVSFRSGLKFDK